jgi:hypothetical protein
MTAAQAPGFDGKQGERIRTVLSAYRIRRSPWATVIFLFDGVGELFGLTLYLQHTHPGSRFFRDRAE